MVSQKHGNHFETLKALEAFLFKEKINHGFVFPKSKPKNLYLDLLQNDLHTHNRFFGNHLSTEILCFLSEETCNSINFICVF